MIKQFYVSLLIVGILCLPAIGAGGPTVLPPNTSSYSAGELAALQAQMPDLRDVLGNYALGSGQYFSFTEWMSQDFAAYTAGILTAKGYEVRLVAQDGWADGEHVWLLVGLPLSTRTAWIPVEASPAMGKSQHILGTIPLFTDGAGQAWFQEKYTAFAREIVLPKNVPPLASIRVVPTQGNVGQKVTFMALASYDPDGEIVRYSWDLAGMKTSDRCTIRHLFDKEGTYKIVLSVIDSRGETTTTSIDYKVRGHKEAAPPSSGGGCGCGS